MSLTLARRPSPNREPRTPGIPVDMLVIHYTGMNTAAEAIERLCNPDAKVSAHYVIDEDGSILQLVDEADRAWHAGQSFWRGETDVNMRSIGIELVNPGHEFGYRPYPKVQMAALIALAKDITTRHAIPARNVVGHSDVAPTRKTDPGELFDWKALAEAGIGAWPHTPRPFVPAPGADLLPLLGAWGYDVRDDEAAILAFQAHFLPTNMTGVLDQPTVTVLTTLLACYPA